MKQFLVAVDSSEGANRAARFASQLAAETNGSVALLYVYDAPTASLLGMEALSPAQMEKARHDVARGSFEAAKRAIGETSVPITTHTALGHPGHEIVSYAIANSPEMIVMGPRGLSPIRGLLLGSVSEYVVRHAQCPVLVVH